MTGNGSAYLSRDFGAAVTAAGLKHKRTRPYTPRTNGKAERFIQTNLREWAYARAYASSHERCAALTPRLDHYNTVRPHAALGHHPPAARLRQAPLLCSTEETVASSRPESQPQGSRPASPASKAPMAPHAAPGAGSTTSRPTSGRRRWPTTWCCSPASNQPSFASRGR
jgi:hypothetical protein